MKTSKLLFLAIAASLTVGGITALKARAQNDGSMPFGGGRLMARIRRQLELTDDQTTRIKSILAADKETLLKELTACHDARSHLRSVIQTTNSSDADVRTAAATVATAQADLAVERAHLFTKISPLLTPAQLTKLNQFEQRIDEFADNAIAEFGKRISP